jgi:hypothetical protein
VVLDKAVTPVEGVSRAPLAGEYAAWGMSLGGDWKVSGKPTRKISRVPHDLTRTFHAPLGVEMGVPSFPLNAQYYL